MSEAVSGTISGTEKSSAKLSVSLEELLDIAVALPAIVLLAAAAGVCTIRGEKLTAGILDVGELTVATVTLLTLLKRFCEKNEHFAKVIGLEWVEGKLSFLINARGVLVLLCYVLLLIGFLFPETTEAIDPVGQN
jgi:hypothetical protein